MQKGRDAFLRVAGCNDPGESSLLDRKPIVYCGVHSAMGRRERCGERQRRFGGKTVSERQRFIEKLDTGYDEIDEAQTCCLGSIKSPASQDQLNGCFRPMLRGRRCEPPKVGMIRC